MKAFRRKHSLFFILLGFLFIHLFVSLLSISDKFSTQIRAIAETENAEEQAEEKLNESIAELIDGLDLQALQEYVDGLDAIDSGSVGERLLEYIKGEKFDYENFGRELISVLFEDVVSLFPAFACIAAIAMLSGVLSALKSGTAGRTSGDMIFLITYAAALIPLLGVLIECFEGTLGAVSSMQTQMQIVFPLLLTLMAASGGTLSVAVCKPAVSFFSTTIVSLISSVVLPLTVTIVAFSMAGNMAKELRVHKFTGFFKSINKWILGISISVFGLFFTLQGITSNTYDGVLRRAAKYAIGNGIPIVGGFLSGGFDLVVAGSILIRNSLGSLSVFLMISVIFEPIVLLLTVNLLLRFTAAVTHPFGDGKISEFLEETAGNMQYCTAGLLFTAFLYFLMILQMISGVEGLL